MTVICAAVSGGMRNGVMTWIGAGNPDRDRATDGAMMAS
jgi:hypothetical protein